MIIPTELSGRPVTNRGVHLLPFGYHGGWMENRDYWLSLMQSMGISWAVVLSAGDAALLPQREAGGASVCQLLLEAGIIPILRFQIQLPRHFTEMAHTRTFIQQCEPYGAPPIVQLWNEPGDGREWSTDMPQHWLEVFVDRWCAAAQFVCDEGGIAGFPDGPCYPVDPFPLIESTWDLWEAQKCAYLGHFYGLNRPHDWPRDDVARFGTPLTQAEYDAALPKFPEWKEWPIEAMNAARRDLANPDLSPLDDDTCWRGWERVASWMEIHFDRLMPLALTEGGWTPGAVAGGGPNTDIRYFKPDGEVVAANTLHTLNVADTPMFAQCPWLLGDRLMGASGAWEQDAWVGEWAQDIYGLEKPVVRALIENPVTYEPWQEIYERVLMIQDLLTEKLKGGTTE